MRKCSLRRPRSIVRQDEWTLRVFEVQAILDLYLGQMRETELQHNRLLPSWRSSDALPKVPPECCAGKCAHYPQLLLSEEFEGVSKKAGKASSKGKQKETAAPAEGKSSSKATPEKVGKAKGEAPQSTFLVTKEHINTHFARRGAHTDHFNHPLLFARPKLRRLTLSSGNRVIVADGKSPDDLYYPSDGDTDDDNDSEADHLYDRYRYIDQDFSWSHSSDQESSRSSPSVDSLINLELEATGYDETVAIATSTLRLLPRLHNLSLTSYLYRCLGRPQPKLSMLTCLSLGPLLPSENLLDFIVCLKLPAVKKLRICGGGLDHHRLARLIGESVEMVWPALMETQ